MIDKPPPKRKTSRRVFYAQKRGEMTNVSVKLSPILLARLEQAGIRAGIGSRAHLLNMAMQYYLAGSLIWTRYMRGEIAHPPAQFPDPRPIEQKTKEAASVETPAQPV